MTVRTLGICPKPRAQFPLAPDVPETEPIAISGGRALPPEGVPWLEGQQACSSPRVHRTGLITRTQHHDADGTLLQYAETIAPDGNWRAHDDLIIRRPRPRGHPWSAVVGGVDGIYTDRKGA